MLFCCFITSRSGPSRSGPTLVSTPIPEFAIFSLTTPPKLECFVCWNRLVALVSCQMVKDRCRCWPAALLEQERRRATIPAAGAAAHELPHTHPWIAAAEKAEDGADAGGAPPRQPAAPAAATTSAAAATAVATNGSCLRHVRATPATSGTCARCAASGLLPTFYRKVGSPVLARFSVICGPKASSLALLGSPRLLLLLLFAAQSVQGWDTATQPFMRHD